MENEKYNRMIGERIKLFRKMRGMTQMQLAEKLGYTSTGTISRIENDGTGMERAKLLAAAKILGVHPYVLAAEEPLSTEQILLLSKFMSMLKSENLEHLRAILNNQ